MTEHRVFPAGMAWETSDLAASRDWVFAVDPGLARLSFDQLLRWSRPLQQQLKQGCGVVLLRGLQDLDQAEFRRLYRDLGRCIGALDTTYGDLYDVTDSGDSHLTKAIPVSQTRAATSMHTDSSRHHTHPRWVGLACVHQAPAGGGSRLASVGAVVAHLQKHEPACVQRLQQSFYRDVVTPGTVDPLPLIAENRFPVLTLGGDGPSLRYMRYWIEKGHQRLDQPLSSDDLWAFDVLDAVLNHPRFCHTFQLCEGDILLIDNHKVVHDREAYDDDPGRPRLLIRLWLNQTP